MKLRLIDEDCLEEAAAILFRGFPRYSAATWSDVLVRLSAYRAAAGVGPIGHLMMVAEKAVGVILTIRSLRGDDAGRHEIVNLSSWYVDPKHRWLAPRMLQQITADGSVTYTDLTPSAEARFVNERLGFRATARGTALFFLPWNALAGAAQGHVVSFAEMPEGAVSPEETEMLAYHHGLGCIVGALQAGGRYCPIIFHIKTRRGLPVAGVVLAKSRDLIADNSGAIARFLLRHGVLFLTVPAHNNERLPGSFLWNPDGRVQAKGHFDVGGIDHTFSELVFLRL